MEKDEVVFRVRAGGLTIASEQRNNNGTGWVIGSTRVPLSIVGIMAT
jgi:hypothetical protein